MTESSFAIVNARVVPVAGEVVEDGAVLVRDGVIAAVGPTAEVTIPEGVRTVDAGGRWVLPGFVEAHGHVGIHEEANGPAGDDTNEMTTPNTAAVRALDAVNIDDEGFRDALSGGVTSVVVKPGSGNPIGGQTVAIKTWGGRTIDEQVIRAAVSVKSALGENPKRVYGGKNQTPSTRLGVAMIIREAFVEAQNYRAQRDEAEKEGKPFARDLAKETLARVLDGELYWDQHTHRHDDIATAIRLADEFGSAAEISMTRYSIARLTDEETMGNLRGMSGVRVLERSDGTLLALFESVYWLQRIESDHPDWRLEPLVAEGMAG